MAIFVTGGASGCALFGGKSDDGGRRWWFSSANSKQKTPSATQNSNNTNVVKAPNGAGDSSQVDGVLAGQVTDAATDMGVQAFIRYTCLDEPQTKSAPIDVTTRTNGYFLIYGLKPGKKYRLLAYTQQGARKLADIQYTTAPNPRLVFRVSDDVNPADIPDIPLPSTLPKNVEPRISTDDAKEKNVRGAGSTKDQLGFGIGKPRALDGSPPSDPLPASRTEDPASISSPRQYLPNIASDSDKLPRLPTAKIPPMFGNPGAPSNSVQKKVPSDLPAQRESLNNSPMPRIPASLRTLPFAVVLSKQIINFGMHDAYGNPWEWKTDRRGSLVLIDFWRTNCPPCLAAIPELRSLQQKYGRDGLEVIGIASEQTDSFDEAKSKVAQLVNMPQLRTNYRLLINSGPRQGEILDQFQVQRLPTLLLVDERGDILWRHVGGLSGSDVAALENQIRMRLNVH